MKTVSAPLELKFNNSKEGEFSGYGAVFNNVDNGDDVILPGAFTKVKQTSDNKLRIALYHDLTQIIGKADFSQDDNGLYVEGKINMGVTYAKDAYHLMKDGVLDGMSVGFNILPGGAKFEDQEDTLIRFISKAELWEVSVVPFGMNEEAKIDTIKAPSNLRDFERFLRGSGFSRKEAQIISSNGFRAYQREAGSVKGNPGDLGGFPSEMLAEYKEAISLFKI